MASAGAPDRESGSSNGDGGLPLSARTENEIDSFRLSPVQEAMFFHTVAAGTPDLYLVQQTIRLTGPVDPVLLEGAWQSVVAKHPALRTVFRWPSGTDVEQVVLTDLDFEYSVGSDAGDPAAAIDRALRSDRLAGFDLENGPLMRIRLIAHESGEHTMLWTHHHLVLDGWSASLVLADLFAAHESLESGGVDSAGVAPGYGEYIAWHASQPIGPTRAFWVDSLAGFDVPTRLAGPAAGEAIDAYTRTSRSLPADVVDRLREFCRSQRLTLNTVLVGAMATVVHCATDADDIALGVVSSGRPPTLLGVESIVGMFINTSVLRVEIDPASSVGDFLRDVQGRQADLLPHSHVALGDLQAWSPSGAATPLTDVLFAYWGFAGSGVSPSGQITYETVDGYGRTGFPVSVTVEAGDHIRVGMDFDARELDSAAAERLLELFERAVVAFLSDPDSSLARISLASDGERRVLAQVNDTARPVGWESVLERFESMVSATPDAVAVTDGERRWTYGELDTASRAVAESVVTRNVAGGAVAVLMPRSLEGVASLLGTMRAGASVIPIDRHLPARRIDHVIRDSGARHAIVEAGLRELVSVEIDFIDPARGSTGMALPATPRTQLAYTMYTSGSTGLPKGVDVSHANLVNYIDWAAATYGRGAPVSMPFATSVGFDLTMTSLFVPLVTGGSIVVYPDDDARALTMVDVFEADDVDVVKLTPSHLALLDDEHLSTRRIHTLVLGGEALPTSQASRAVVASEGRLTVFNEYGPTEATVGCMIHRFDESVDTDSTVPIGRPIANAQVHVLDRHQRPVPIGVSGEIYVGGAGVAVGYRNRRDLTDQRFVAVDGIEGRLYRTGDLGQWNAHGVLLYEGRNDDQMKIRGIRVEPAEIETAMLDHPAVAEAAVALREPRAGDVRLVAYYVPSRSESFNVTDVREHLQRALPDALIPRHLVPIDAVPLTANGKLDRPSLPETIGAVTTVREHINPRNQAEALVAEMAADVLGVERVSLGDNFFDLGGHSILAMQLIARLHARTGIRISPRVVLLNPLEQVAAQLPTTDDAGRSSQGAGTAAVRTATPFYFGNEEPLFGLAYAPLSAAERERAVLLCAPIGWEYMRTHWALRNLARQLSEDGFHVLRFDYFGTGDSSGATGSGNVKRWLDDIDRAAAELLHIAQAKHLTVVGVRLGATLAAHAVERGLNADQLVLWDPIDDGAAFIASLERMNDDSLTRRRGARPSPDVVGDDLLGFPFPESLRRELRGLSLRDVRLVDRDVRIIWSSAELSAAELPRQWRDELVPDEGAWSDVSAAQAALLPRAIPATIRAAVTGA